MTPENANATVFVVGFVPDGSPWEVVGVFTTRAAAEAQCLDYRYFVGPLEANAATPKPAQKWVDSYYPNQSTP